MVSSKFVKIFLRSSIFIALPLIPFFVYANNPYDVVVNEIAWMGTETSYNDEWIELYNKTGSTIDLSGWVLKTDGRLKINLSGKIAPYSYLLLERSDDETVPNVKADLIYRGALSNNGEKISLFDKGYTLIDGVDCSEGWFKGSNLIKKTMERINPDISGSEGKNWQTSKKTGGTPGAPNSQPEVFNKDGSEKEIKIVDISFWDRGKESLSILAKAMTTALFLTIVGLSLKLKERIKI